MSMTLRTQGDNVQEEAIEALRERYGLGQPIYVQYGKWIWGILTRGDWGQSMEWQKPVKELIWERMALTVVLSLISMHRQLVYRDTTGGLFRHPPVFDPRLYRDHHSALSASARPASCWR